MKTPGWTPDTTRSTKIPKRNDERVILHFDYDCFYASVFENENPSLKSQPLGVRQKSILATCNYVARARGVRKLMSAAEAQRVCPDLVLLNGEDLTRFRGASRRLWACLRAHSWGGRVERLGLDEVFLDVTDAVAYNAETLNTRALAASFFHLDRADPARGFAFDGSRFAGRVVRAGVAAADDANALGEADARDPLCVRLMLASHLTAYLRHRLDEDFGYTSSGGISTSKLLAKLAGSVHKPNNQTTLLPTGGDGGSDMVGAFMDAHNIRKVPGIGSRIAQLIEEYLLSRPAERRDREGAGSGVTVGEVRRHPGMSADLLEQILDRPGAERGSGEKVWNLLHGADASEVKEASDVPTQISVEDTYMARPLQTPAEAARELRALAASLVRRMRVDLTAADMDPQDPLSAPRWLAHPKTLRLSTRTKPKQAVPPPGTSTSGGGGAEVPSFSRSSRSAPLPSFVFHFSASAPAAPPCEEIAERLVAESLLPLFRRLHPERGGGWNLTLLNVCVTNMVVVAGESGPGSGVAPGRDIGRMFRTQEDKLREWTVYDPSPLPAPPSPALPAASVDDDSVENAEGALVEADMQPRELAASSSPPADEGGDEDSWEQQDESDSQRCHICGHAIPAFAISAHLRFHSMGE
ncbi:hypothetical protein F4802DRAFT_440023 [Xylaria palmicola]|nr:hypothetical protein F4802DRAFT_440023 [Xylaria palmicola]